MPTLIDHLENLLIATDDELAEMAASIAQSECVEPTHALETLRIMRAALTTAAAIGKLEAP